MSKHFLKIKVTSLAAEQKLIRAEERRFKKRKQGAHPVREALYFHRTKDIRPELRCANLAYGFLKGIPYKTMETKAYTQPDWTRVRKLAEKFGEDDSRVIAQRYAQWLSEAGVT